MISNIKVSVIIPFYSKKEYLAEAIDSVFMQTHRNFEILLIDDGSKEDILDIISMYPEKLKYFRQENKGAAAARNAGIEVAIGDYIAFLDADDLWKNTKLETQIQYMVESDFKWSHTSYLTFTGEKVLSVKQMEDFRGNVFPKCLASNPIATPCVMIETSILKNDSQYRFKENMKSGEDSFLWMLLAMNHDIGYINESLTKVRLRGTNSSLLAWHQLRARAEIWGHIKKNNVFNIHTTLSLPIKIAYTLCYEEYKLLKRLIFKKDEDSKAIEMASKFFYLIPWTIFKTHK